MLKANSSVGSPGSSRAGPRQGSISYNTAFTSCTLCVNMSSWCHERDRNARRYVCRPGGRADHYADGHNHRHNLLVAFNFRRCLGGKHIGQRGYSTAWGEYDSQLLVMNHTQLVHNTSLLIHACYDGPDLFAAAAAAPSMLAVLSALRWTGVGVMKRSDLAAAGQHQSARARHIGKPCAGKPQMD
jgi:hypothetical protein